MTPQLRQLLFGTDEALPAALPLSCGRLSTRLRGTRLGPICWDGHEVWHGVDFLYRDPDWGTPLPVVETIDIARDGDGLHLRLQARIAAGAGIACEIAIDIDETGLDYRAQCTPLADLATNRTGIVLMHPLDVCGDAVEIEHVDGRRSRSTFPELIAPWPPFMLVRAIRHEFAAGAWAGCRFEGDDFELEDQRNNADASFKTYNRSNLMPRPYVLRGGTLVRQSVHLRIDAEALRHLPARPRAGQAVRISVGAPAASLPRIGTALRASDLQHAKRLVGALDHLRPGHLHLCLSASSEPPDTGALARLLEAAGGCALRLDIEGLTVKHAEAQLDRIAVRLQEAGLVPAAVLPLPSTPPIVEAARRAFPRSRIGAGTPHFFTQLNRSEDLGVADFLSFSTASVVHGADDEDIMCGLRSLPAMLQTLRHRHGAVPLQIGPSSIGARRSPLGGQPDSDGRRRLALARRDPRSRGLYGAAWALGYVAQLARDGVEAISLFELQGDAALFEGGGRGGGEGEAAAGTPAAELLRLLGRPARCRTTGLSEPAPLAALALEHEGSMRLLCANLGGESLELRIDGIDLPGKLQIMDADALLARADGDASPWRGDTLRGSTLCLPAYGIALI